MGEEERTLVHVHADDEPPVEDPPGLVLGPMLRYVSETEATIWVETSEPGTVSVLHARAPTFAVRGRHYALVVVTGLQPGSVTSYDVRLDGERVWPVDDDLPPSVIRTSSPDQDVVALIGSCRAAAPHEQPFTLESMTDPEGRGVDTLWAHALRMAGEDVHAWPDLLILAGDQIYADDSSPRTRRRVERRRSDDDGLDPAVVADFDEYCMLYHEAWSARWERWLFSVVPTVMIFDDHDMIDDWNISASWVDEMRHESWWPDHVLGSLMSYWIYQHLGNLSPAEIASDGLLDRLTGSEDGTAALEQWAQEVHAHRSRRYRFSFRRDVGPVRVVVIDGRHGRELADGRREMVAPGEWAWVRDRALEHRGHVMLVTTLPVFIASGLHDLHVWNDRVCAGAWGRLGRRFGERVRRALDLEDWPAFPDSFAAFVALIDELCAQASESSTVVVASGDIHFSYVARVRTGPTLTRVHQVVSSPIRNALIPPERGVMRLTLTRVGSKIGAGLRRSVGQRPSRSSIEMEAGPFFANNMCLVSYRGASVTAVVEQAVPDGDGGGQLNEVARVRL